MWCWNHLKSQNLYLTTSGLTAYSSSTSVSDSGPCSWAEKTQQTQVKKLFGTWGVSERVCFSNTLNRTNASWPTRVQLFHDEFDLPVVVRVPVLAVAAQNLLHTLHVGNMSLENEKKGCLQRPNLMNLLWTETVTNEGSEAVKQGFFINTDSWWLFLMLLFLSVLKRCLPDRMDSVLYFFLWHVFFSSLLRLYLRWKNKTNRFCFLHAGEVAFVISPFLWLPVSRREYTGYCTGLRWHTAISEGDKHECSASLLLAADQMPTDL